MPIHIKFSKGVTVMLSINDVKGVIPPIITPVDSEENVDKAGLQRVIDHVIDGGVHGVFVLEVMVSSMLLIMKTRKERLKLQ